uniref:Cell wall integrity and stress response component 4-like n=1 Tax=Acanthochromis polyacanthus TaxID=80966 RepID=A0A3Q1FBK2_9TELE
MVAALACCLLALSFAVVQTENNTETVTTPKAQQPNSTAHVTDMPTLSEDTTRYTGTTEDKGAFTKTTAAKTESTNQPQTSQSTTMSPPPASLKTTTPTTQTPTFTTLTTQANQTAADNTSTPNTTAVTTGNSSHTVSATPQPVNRTTNGLGLNASEKTITIVFSAVLGAFGAALLMFMVHKCKHKIQFMSRSSSYNQYDDTLVISGGLYDDHPIYDNVPPVPGNESQFRLEFI